MPKTRKTLQPKNLEKYDVLIEDRNPTSTYFQITNLPQQLTGGRNSFLIAGSSLLKRLSNIQIEIIDAAGNTIFNTPIQRYVEGTSRLVSIYIYDNVRPGFATLTVVGEANTLPNGRQVPSNWQNKVNVRWQRRILVEPNTRNISPILLDKTPEILLEEKFLYNPKNATYISSSIKFTASLSPILYSGYPVGYMIKAVTPTTFSADYSRLYVTGGLQVNDVSASLYLPITEVLNKNTAFSSGYIIKTTEGKVINKLYLTSGSYPVQGIPDVLRVTSSANLVYEKLIYSDLVTQSSYAKLRIFNLNTVSGEIYKLKIYNKIATNISDYKLIADVPVVTKELLTSESLEGSSPIGNFNSSGQYVSTNWYADVPIVTNNIKYRLSGSGAYYNSSLTVTPFSLDILDDPLLRSVKAEIPVYNNEKYADAVSESGYFIGTKKGIRVSPQTEYTLQLDMLYKNTSGSTNLIGIEPKVDIYIIGSGSTKIADNDPLGQKIGTVNVGQSKLQYQQPSTIQWYQNQQFNFIPNIPSIGDVSLRFLVSNGFWNFSEISIKAASDRLFSPDEVEILVPNTEYNNQLLQYKVEFFGINNNSTEVSATSIPVFFTGSSN